MRSKGFVSLVGAGPGALNLITLAGEEAISRCDVVVYDKLIHPLLLDAAPTHAERLFVGKQAGNVYLPQASINQLLIDLARQGKRVVRLKGGDPLIFARGAEELEALAKAGIDFEVIPGVTAALACAATAGIPLTHRGESSLVTFVTGHEDPLKSATVDWASLAHHHGTIAIYMARSKMAEIAKALLSGGRDGETPVAFIQWGGTHRQRVHVTTLAESVVGIPPEIGTPMLTIVGEVVRHRREISWIERQPLFGKNVVLLRSVDSSASLLRRLDDLGAMTWIEPIMKFVPPDDWADVDSVIDHFSGMDWLVFVSRPGVRHFWRRVWERGLDARCYRGKIASMGPGTTEELSRFHLRADYEARENRAEGLSRELRDAVAGKNVAIIHADRGRQTLEFDWIPVADSVRSVVGYRQIDIPHPSLELLEILQGPGNHWIFLTSGNVARQFAQWLDAHPTIRRESLRFVSIGPSCRKLAVEAGLVIDLEAKVNTPDGMIDAMLEQASQDTNNDDH